MNVEATRHADMICLRISHGIEYMTTVRLDEEKASILISELRHALTDVENMKNDKPKKVKL